ncbi:MAG: hypothetical protein ACREDO_11880 [Methyloceanibacter sp.]
MAMDRGPGGRKHGEPLGTHSDAVQRLEQKDRYRKRSREERRAKPDFDDLQGEPGVLREDVEDENALPPEFHEAMSERAEAHVDELDQRAKSQGVGLAPWNTDAATETEYYGKPRGLPESIKSAERMRITDQFGGWGRSDVDDYNDAAGWLNSLREDFIQAYPEQSSDTEELKAAAQRVWAKWARQGSRDLKRRVERNRDQFLAELSDELILTPSGNEREPSGGTNRTQGFDSSLGGGRGARSAEAEREGPSLSEELEYDQKRGGYY